MKKKSKKKKSFLASKEWKSLRDETFIPYFEVERQYKYLIHKFPLAKKEV